MDNESWVIEEGHRVNQKKAGQGFDSLTDWERLVYSLWVADYGMRNAGELETATDLHADWQSVALRAAEALSLPATRAAFALTPAVLQQRYFDLFDAVCAEVRTAEPSAAPDSGGI
jgi:hypothetical protein